MTTDVSSRLPVVFGIARIQCPSVGSLMACCLRPVFGLILSVLEPRSNIKIFNQQTASLNHQMRRIFPLLCTNSVFERIAQRDSNMFTLRGLTQKIPIFHKHSTIIPLLVTKSLSNNSRFCVFSTASPSSSSSSSSTTLSTKRVGTHSGSFHCDEALACFIIRLTDKFSNAQIVRTRDPLVLDTLDAVLDVGGMYDPNRDRYDHHQKGFEEVFGHGFNTKLSSAGLVYKHFGVEIIAKELQLDKQHPEAIDAVDNGINQYDTDQLPGYVDNTTLSFRLGRLNPDWVDPDHSSERENEGFQRAMTLAGSEFLESIHFHAKSWLPARSIVMECLAARKNIDSSGEIMVLTRNCPWKLHIFELEEEMKIEPSIKYVIYQNDRNENWRLQAVAVSPDNFESRKPLPLLWRGLENDKLSKVAGIPGCVFVHISGFIGANQSYECALAMARAPLKA